MPAGHTGVVDASRAALKAASIADRYFPRRPMLMPKLQAAANDPNTSANQWRVTRANDGAIRYAGDMKAGAKLTLFLLSMAATAATSAAGPASPGSGGFDLTGHWAVVVTPEMIAKSQKEGLSFGMPLNAEYQVRREQRLAAVKDGRPYADAAASCMPYGLPRMMLAINSVIQMVQTPRELVMLSGESSEFRHVYIDGRSHPDDPDSSFEGHSIGHFEGDTLVIDTIAIKEGLPAEGDESHSDAMRITERLRRVSATELDYSATSIDPKAFTAPWVLHWRYQRQSEPFEWTEYVCTENNRNPPDAEGRQTVRTATGASK